MNSKFLTKSGGPKYKALYQSEELKVIVLQNAISDLIDQRDSLIKSAAVSLGAIDAETARADKAEAELKKSLIISIIFQIILQEVWSLGKHKLLD